MSRCFLSGLRSSSSNLNKNILGERMEVKYLENLEAGEFVNITLNSGIQNPAYSYSFYSSPDISCKLSNNTFLIDGRRSGSNSYLKTLIKATVNNNGTITGYKITDYNSGGNSYSYIETKNPNKKLRVYKSDASVYAAVYDINSGTVGTAMLITDSAPDPGSASLSFLYDDYYLLYTNASRSYTPTYKLCKIDINNNTFETGTRSISWSLGTYGAMWNKYLVGSTLYFIYAYDSSGNPSSESTRMRYGTINVNDLSFGSFSLVTLVSSTGSSNHYFITQNSSGEAFYLINYNNYYGDKYRLYKFSSTGATRLKDCTDFNEVGAKMIYNYNKNEYYIISGSSLYKLNSSYSNYSLVKTFNNLPTDNFFVSEIFYDKYIIFEQGRIKLYTFDLFTNACSKATGTTCYGITLKKNDSGTINEIAVPSL